MQHNKKNINNNKNKILYNGTEHLRFCIPGALYKLKVPRSAYHAKET